MKNNKKEGDLYKEIKTEDTTFVIKYGYYPDDEKLLWPPIPIYPDFIQNPVYTKDGNPYVTTVQDICEHYEAKPHASDENWCNDCIYFELVDEDIGICRCSKRKLNTL